MPGIKNQLYRTDNRDVRYSRFLLQMEQTVSCNLFMRSGYKAAF